VGLVGAAGAEELQPAARVGGDERLLARLAAPGAAGQAGGENPAQQAVQTGQVVTVDDIGAVPGARWRAALQERGLQSAIALPLGDAGGVIGVLAICATQVRAFPPEETALLTELAGDLAYGIRALRSGDERRRMAQALQASEEKYRTLIENIDVGIYRREALPSGRLVHANAAALRLMGLTDQAAAGRFLQELIRTNADARLLTEETERTGSVRGRELTVSRADGVQRVLRVNGVVSRDAHGEVRYVDTVLQDITDEKMLLRRLLHSEKLAALGRMSAAVAHEMNQPLNAIRNYCQEIALNLRDQVAMTGAEIGANMQRATEQVDRMAEIIRNMRVFTQRDQEQALLPIPADRLVRYPISLMAAQLRGRGVEVAVELPAEPPLVMGNEPRLQQVLINLLSNARDAIAARTADAVPAGRIMVRVTRDGSAGTVVFSVADNGCGIRPELREKIFEPFFTTKEADYGMGLGLSLSYDIVAQHNGGLAVTAEEGKDTVFTMTLPAAS
ncbi:MAG TPA: ATP-binding protein, partial [bacterium]|nr:ATP-binding protein [bacterium]